MCVSLRAVPYRPGGHGGVRRVSVPTLLCHAESHALGLGSDHEDVLHWFPRLGASMSALRADVAALMKESRGLLDDPPPRRNTRGGLAEPVTAGPTCP